MTGRRNVLFILSLISLFWDICWANDVLGCGGYVTSDFEINFSQVGIKLFTRQGNLKYETECAPNNGYYFIPLYDKGEYVIKVAPPPGWTFKPDQVALKVDGETDECSLGKDINFHFQGFAVIGKVVSIGSETGPAGITVSLQKEDKVLLTTQTDSDGSYVFTPLSSGVYTVVASHPTWTLLIDRVPVEVADENGDAGSSMVVGGYTLSGSAISDGQPTPGISIVFHAHGTAPITPECTPGGPEGYQSSLDIPVVCHVVSDQNGAFIFGSISPGTYTLVPFFQSDTTKYEVTPNQLEVVVGHDDLALQQPFKVEGFSLSGVVTKGPSGEAVAQAKVLLDKSRSATTDENGVYVFHNVQSGKHRIKVTSDKYEFDEQVVLVSPQQPLIPAISPSKYQVCFYVGVDKAATHQGPWTIETVTSTGVKKNLQTDADGHGCIYLPAGSYTASVKLSSAADEAGMRFGPLAHEFTVASEAVGDLVFSQFLGEVHGKIVCLEKCSDLTVALRPTSGSGAQAVASAVEGTFIFTDVVPGTYQLSIQKEDWCWKQKSVPVTINTENVEVSLEQIGYQLTVASSHETTLSYSTSMGATGTVVAQKGNTIVCVSSPGIYTFTPVGCHKFGTSQIQWNTASPKLISLSASKHQLTGAIRATEAASFTVGVKVGSQVTILGPLNPSPEDPHLYVFEHWVQEGETIVLTPGSPTNLYQYEPASHTITMPADCVLNAVTFKAERALFIYGRITPPLGGVTINVEGNGQVYTYTTDAEGKYTAGPLDNAVQFSVSAEKRGYVMNALREKGHFEAYKLAEVVVEVKDENGTPLPGVLVSMSGGKSYRQNSLTENDGTIAFQSLTPADYFLRPMMKEYNFDPPSKMVTVDEGATIMVSISGIRVAYSIYGQTASLSGEPETDVVVEAVGQGGECDQYQEEAVSDATGSFRIRGLLPKCEYDLRLKSGSDINQHVERTLPSTRTIHTDNADIRDLKLIVLRPFTQMDVAAKVNTDPQHLSSLVARLYREDLPDSPIHTVKLGLHPYFLLPPMTADKRTYFLRLESTLPTSQYEYTIPEVTFVADSAFRHLNLTFNPVLRSVDAELNQGTVLGFVIAILVVAAAFNYSRLGPMLEKASGLVSNMAVPKPAQKPTSSTSSDIPIIEAVRKKVKPRKV